MENCLKAWVRKKTLFCKDILCLSNRSAPTQSWSLIEGEFPFPRKLYILSFSHERRAESGIPSESRPILHSMLPDHWQLPHVSDLNLSTFTFLHRLGKSGKSFIFIWGRRVVVSPMLSGHFSGSVVVTADLEKNMNSSSSRFKTKESSRL